MNIGDRVLAEGKLGTITCIYESDLGLPYTVGFMNGEWDVFSEESLQLAARATYTNVI